jgi:hypothetical protein
MQEEESEKKDTTPSNKVTKFQLQPAGIFPAPPKDIPD